jgi:hypothetical protein
VSKTFHFAVVLALFLIALAAFRFSENGRYHYTDGLVVDTRSGQAWPLDGNAHYNPRAGIVTAHHVQLKDSTALEACMDGKSVNWFLHPLAMRACRSQQALANEVQMRFPHWQTIDIGQYLKCTKDALPVWKSETATRTYCEVEQERQYWMRWHPEIAGHMERFPAFTSAKLSQCFHDNAAKLNAAPQDFHTAYDSCLDQAYSSDGAATQGKFSADEGVPIDFQPEKPAASH